MTEIPVTTGRRARGVSLGRWLRPWIGTTALLLAACGGGDNGSAPPPPPPPPPPVAKTAQVDIAVFDTLGHFVEAAKATVGTTTATTDANGRAVLAVPTGSEQVIAITKSDFAEQFKVLNLAADATTGSLQAMLIARAPAQPIASIEAGGSATGRDGVKVTFPPNALVTAAGQAVTGTVQMLMTPVDITGVSIGAFPGLFAGVAPGASRHPIVSFGTAELLPTQGGVKLALASGASADIELPIYVRTYQDGTPIKVGDSIPLWSLNTTTGVWEQDGAGQIATSSASPTGLSMRATIRHFSWWNSDAFANNGTVVLTVNAPGENLPAGTVVNVTGTIINGGPTATRSDTVNLGVARQLNADAGSTTRLDASVESGSKSCRGSVNVSPPTNGSVAATINLVCITVPTPRIVLPSAATSTNSSRDLFFHIVMDGGNQRPDLVELLVDGAPVASFTSAQQFYVGFWNSSSFAEGTHVLRPRATLAGVARTGDPVSVIVDRTGPQMVATSPAADQDVDRDTVFTIDFSEPVTAAPFTLSDVVKLTVLPIGQSTPVEIAFTPGFANSQSSVTVKADEPLPLGVASVSWGGLRDAAGNSVTGTLTASWTVSRSARIAADLPIKPASNVSMTTDSAGIAYLLRLQANTGDLQALKFNGSDFAPVGPVVNDRPMVTNFSGAGSDDAAIAVAGDGTIYVAFEQLDAVGTNIEVPVRKYDSASNTWRPVAAAFAINHVPSSTYSARPRLAVDATNRPVLVFIGSTAQALETYRFENGAWVPLGLVGGNVFGSAAGGCQTGNVIVVAESVATSPAGRPGMALYCNDVFGASVVAVEHDGTSWVWLSGAVIERQGGGYLGAPVIRYAPDGKPSVAWFGPGEVKLARFNGTAFTQEVFTPAIETYNGQVALTFLNGDPVVAGAYEFHGGKVDLRRFHAGAWEPQSLINVIGDTVSLSLAASGDTVLLGQGGNDAARVTRIQFP